MMEWAMGPGLIFAPADEPLGRWLESEIENDRAYEVTGHDPATIRLELGWN
jgi:hypothetical protein